MVLMVTYDIRGVHRVSPGHMNDTYGDSWVKRIKGAQRE